MTPTDRSELSPSRRPSDGGRDRSQRPEAAGGRRAVATAAGFLAGLIAAGILLGLGLLVYRRLLAGSQSGLVAILLIFGAAGAYAGWLLGVIVYGALRGETNSSAP